jgi:type VI secretion system protein ImpK
MNQINHQYSLASVEKEQSNSDLIDQRSVESNDLIRLATPLILLMTQIRHTTNHPNVEAFRAQVISEIRNFESKLRLIHCPEQTIVAARYCLCTAIDEAVLSQVWGRNSVWVQGSLLSTFHKETWGGERFYVILEEAMTDRHTNINFIEFAYFLLSLGFEGKLFGDENKVLREETRMRIFNCIHQARIRPIGDLSPHWKNTDKSLRNKNRFKLFLRVGLVSLAVLMVAMIFYNLQVYSQSKSTINDLNNLAIGSSSMAFNNLGNAAIANPKQIVHKQHK